MHRVIKIFISAKGYITFIRVLYDQTIILIELTNVLMKRQHRKMTAMSQHRDLTVAGPLFPKVRTLFARYITTKSFRMIDMWH